MCPAKGPDLRLHSSVHLPVSPREPARSCCFPVYREQTERRAGQAQLWASVKAQPCPGPSEASRIGLSTELPHPPATWTNFSFGFAVNKGKKYSHLTHEEEMYYLYQIDQLCTSTSVCAANGRCPGCEVTPGSLSAVRSGVVCGLHCGGKAPSSPLFPAPGTCALSPSRRRMPLLGLDAGKPGRL